MNMKGLIALALLTQRALMGRGLQNPCLIPVICCSSGLPPATFPRPPSSARRLFRGSLLYLPLLLLGVVVHRQPNTHEVDLAYIRRMLQEQHGITLPTLPQLPEVRMRTFHERLSYVVDMQQQMKCPSRVYGEVRPDGEEQQQQQSQKQE